MAPLSRRRLDSLGLGFDSAALERDQSGAEEWTIAVAFGTPPQVRPFLDCCWLYFIEVKSV